MYVSCVPSPCQAWQGRSKCHRSMANQKFLFPVSCFPPVGSAVRGTVIKIQESEKQNSGKGAEIPNSPEEITMPTLLHSHRILLVTESPLGDPKGAPGENRLTCNLAAADFKKCRAEINSVQIAGCAVSKRARQNSDDRRKTQTDPKSSRGEIKKRASLQQKISRRGLQIPTLIEFSDRQITTDHVQVS